jgi:hypothetical protein
MGQNIEKDLRAELMRDLPKEWEKYKARARNLQVEAVLSSSATAPQVLRMVRTDVLKQANGSAICIWGHTDVLEGDPGRASTDKVWGQNPAYSFELSRPNPGKNWAASQIEIGNNRYLGTLDRSIVDFVFGLVTGQFRIQDSIPMAEALQKKEFAIRKVSDAQVGGRRLVKLEFDWDKTKSIPAMKLSGWVNLDPNSYWHICGARYDVARKGFDDTREIEYEYAKLKDGLPVVKRSTIKSDGKDDQGRKYVSTLVVDWTVREQEKVAEREFKLSAFGLPEPMEREEAGARPYHLWLFAAALGFFCLAGACQSLKNRGLLGNRS